MLDRIDVPLQLEGFEVTSSEVIGGVLEVEVRSSRKPACHHCGSVSVTGHGTNIRRIRDRACAYPTVLLWRQRRLRCNDCYATFRERHPEIRFGPIGAPPSVRRPCAADAVFGWAVLYALHARSSIERGRYWQARYFISNLVNHGLDLACLRLSLPTYYGKGYDSLPQEVRDRFTETLTTSLEPDGLRVALRSAVGALLDEALAAGIDPAVKIETRLRGVFSL